MARRRSTAAKQSYGEPVFTWAFRSSQPRGGTFVTYETRLEENGTLRCNCMGWVFQRKDKNTGEPLPRRCRHTDQVNDEGEVREIMRKFRAGEELPVFVDPTAPQISTIGVTSGRMSSATPNMANAPKSADHSKIKYGRLIQLD